MKLACQPAHRHCGFFIGRTPSGLSGHDCPGAEEKRLRLLTSRRSWCFIGNQHEQPKLNEAASPRYGRSEDESRWNTQCN